MNAIHAIHVRKGNELNANACRIGLASNRFSIPKLPIPLWPYLDPAIVRFPQGKITTVDLGQRQRATMWKWTKPTIELSTAWLEATWATAMDPCCRTDESEKSTTSA